MIVERTGERLRECPKGFVFMMIKPLGLETQIMKEIYNHIRTQADVVIQMQVTADKEKIEAHYENIKYNKDGSVARHFYPITSYLQDKKMRALILEDVLDNRDPNEFVKQMRELVGNSNPLKTQSGQIRHLALSQVLPYHQVMVTPSEGNNSYCRDNLVHCSDSLDAAIHEIGIWMPEMQEVYQSKYERIKNK